MVQEAEESDDTILIVLSEMCKKGSHLSSYISTRCFETLKHLITKDFGTTLSYYKNNIDDIARIMILQIPASH